MFNYVPKLFTLFIPSVINFVTFSIKVTLITFFREFFYFFIQFLITYHIFLFFLTIVTIIFFFFCLFKKKYFYNNIYLWTFFFLFLFIVFFWSINFSLYFYAINFFYLLGTYGYIFMVGSTITYKITDKRQKIIKISPQKSKLYLLLPKCFEGMEEFLYWLQPKPFDPLMLLDLKKPIKFYTSSIDSSNFLRIELSSKDIFWFSLFLRLNCDKLYTPMDSSYISQKETTISAYSCLLTGFFLLFFSKCDVMWSISRLYSSFSWVERELREFYKLNVIGLNDTRRLLTNYTATSYNYEDHKTTSYDNIIQNIYFIGCYSGFIHLDF